MKTHEPNSRRTNVRKWVFRALAIVLSVLAAEVLLDIAGWISPRIHYYLSTPWSRVVIADNVLVHRMSPYYPGNDAWGFRNPAVPDRCEILAIGDSMTYGFAATPENSWPRQLEKLTGKSTYNMSCGGYGFCQYEVLLERGLSLRPTVVILGLCVGNDFRDAYHVAYATNANCPAKRFKSDDADLLSVLRATDKSTPIVDPRLEPQNQEDSSGNIQKWISSHSSLYGIARELRSQIGSKQYYSILREDDPPQDAFELCLQRPGRVSYNPESELRTVFSDPELGKSRFDMNDPRTQEGIRIGEAIILSMRAKVEEAGARFLIVLIPPKDFVYRDLLARSNPPPPESYFGLVEAERLFIESLEAFLRTHAIDYVNPTDELRTCLLNNKRTYPESDDGHLNKHGYAAVAETIVPSIGESAN